MTSVSCAVFASVLLTAGFQCLFACTCLLLRTAHGFRLVISFEAHCSFTEKSRVIKFVVVNLTSQQLRDYLPEHIDDRCFRYM